MDNISVAGITLRLLLLAIVILQRCHYCQSQEIKNFMTSSTGAPPFPLCLNMEKLLLIKDKNRPPRLRDLTVEAFDLILEALNYTNTKINNKNYNESVVKSMPFHSITLDRITVPVLNAYNLRQWMHITIDFTKFFSPPPGPEELPVDFLIMQPVGSPLGLPFGEFRTDVSCLDDDDLKGIPKHQYIVPCTYRPRSAVRHPHIYVAHDPNGFSQIHFNFNWINSICQEVIAMQFLILYRLKDYHETIFKTAITPAILLEKKDSKDGVPYPYYTGWEKEKVRCHGLQENKIYPEEIAEPVPAKVDPCVFRIVHNEEYHKCIAEDIGTTPDLYKTCPPGPFYCQENLELAAEKNKKLVDKFPGIVIASNIEDYMEMLSRSWAYCPFMEDGGLSGVEDCDGPNRLYITELCFRRDHEMYDSEREGFSLDRIGINEHALLMMTALFFQTLNSYYARFFKEAGKKGIKGYRFWLLTHFLLTFLTILFMWLGAAKPSGSVLTSHGVIGFMAATMYHMNIVLGFIRPIKEQKRIKLIISHSVLGYVSQFLIVIAGLITLSCTSTKIFIIVSQLTMIAIYLGVTYASTLGGENKILYLRKLIPVPETLEITPFKPTTIILAVLPLPIIIGMLVLAILNYYSYATSTDPNPKAECQF